jgi:DNA polymerase-3 subunit alpha
MTYSLQNYTTYSILSGLKEPKEWTKQAKELGYTHLGICDKQTMGSLIGFQTACLANEIKPILGMEVVVVTTTDMDKRKDAVKIGILLLYAKNEKGFKNLIKINNFSHDKEGGFYYSPKVDLEFLRDHSDGIICVSPSVCGVGSKVSDKLKKLSHIGQLQQLSEIYRSDFYLGVNPNLHPDSKYWDAERAFLDTDIQKVLTFNCHYPSKDVEHLYEVVRNVDKNAKYTRGTDREVIDGFLPPKDITLPDGYKQAQLNLDEIAKKVDYLIPLGTYYMPKVFLRGESVDDDIVQAVLEGFKNKICSDVDLQKVKTLDDLYQYGDRSPDKLIRLVGKDDRVRKVSEYVDRLKSEFAIIKEIGFLDYFHIVDDICKQNKGRAPGRGSAAGSLTCHTLNITDVDSIYHGLLFERFLNPARKDLPDIDIDFSGESIGFTKDYLRERYGEEKVFPIITYSRMKVSSAIRKVASAYAYAIPDNEGNLVQYDNMSLNLAVKVPHVKQTSRGREELNERLEYSNFQAFYERHSNWVENIIMPLQDAIVGVGMHAAGTIIINDDRDSCLPVEYNSNLKGFVTQWVDKDCERRGYPKFDLLTIKALDVIERAKQIIYEERGVRVPDLGDIPLDDQPTLDIFRGGFTGGIFQFNTYTQRAFLPELKPDSFDDLVACLALCRPGPMNKGFDIEYTRVKNGLSPLRYDHPDLEDILKHTYGFMIYQEDMMKIVQRIGGMTPVQAEQVRRACGKKLVDKMAELEDIFVEGALKKGYEEDFVNDMWSKIKDFAEYSFNKSHSVSYTLISYYQAYLKIRYPTEYWCAALQFSNDKDDSDSGFVQMKYEAASEGMEFVYPTIKKFATDFRPANEYQIIWPLGRVKNIGDTALAEIAKEGTNSFKSMEEMVEVCERKKLRKNNYDALITAGFFDPLFKPWEAAERFYDLIDQEVPYSMASEDVYSWILRRNEAFGMIVKSWKEIFSFSRTVRAFKGTELNEVPDGTTVTIGGYVKDIKNRKTKNGGYYARGIIVDEGEEHVVMLWSKFWENENLDRENRRPEKGQLVEIKGVKDSFNDRAQILVGGYKEPGYVRIVR